jgi:hypothetical protein
VIGGLVIGGLAPKGHDMIGDWCRATSIVRAYLQYKTKSPQMH